MGTPPPPPPPTPQPDPVQRPGSRLKGKYFIAGVLAILVVGIIVNAVISDEATCTTADRAALSTIASGAEPSYAVLPLASGYAYPVTLTWPSGDTADGYLVAAHTPAGIGVWAMDWDADGGATGNIQAVNAAAHVTANWGGDLPTPVTAADMEAAAACVPSA